MANDNISAFHQLLKQNNQRITKARETTFKLLINHEPQTIRQIQAKAAGSVDRVSIYRSIDLFEKLGIVHRVYVGWKYKLELSDQFMPHHHHLSCLGCGKIINIQDEAHIDTFVSEITQRYGFKPERHQFEIEGYCASCLKPSPKSAKILTERG